MNYFDAAKQLDFEIEGGISRPVKSPSRSAVRLTERDLDLFRFVLEMKFASLEDLHRKFFRRLPNGEESHSLGWAQERLGQLKKAGYLSAQFSFSESARLYTATMQAYRAVEANDPSGEWVKPVGGFDLRLFDHDRFVIQSRLELEEKAGATDWISDRRLRQGCGIIFGLSAESVPDGIYTLPSGARVAFELEATQKAKNRYREKIARYARLMRDRRFEERMFREVHYHCLKEPIAKFLEDETRMYGEMFRIEFVATSLSKRRS